MPLPPALMARGEVLGLAGRGSRPGQPGRQGRNGTIWAALG